MQRRSVFEKALGSLVGLPLVDAGYAADMPTWQFGDMRSHTDARGRERWIGQFALHVQCPWRLIHEGRIVVGAEDLTLPADARVDADEWDGSAPRFMALLNGWLEAIEPAHRTVVSATADDLGGFSLGLAATGALECFPVSSLPPTRHSELWRLFRPGTLDAHFVVLAGGVVETATEASEIDPKREAG